MIAFLGILVAIAFPLFIAYIIRPQKPAVITNYEKTYNGITFSVTMYNRGLLETHRGVSKVRQTVIVVDKSLPNIFLDAHTEGTGRVSVHPYKYDNSQKLELEGDFYRNFALYTPDELNIEALSMITPDVMSLLIDKFALSDLYVVNNKIYLTTTDYDNSIYTNDDVNTLISKLSNYIKNISDTDQESNEKYPLSMITGSEVIKIGRRQISVETLVIVTAIFLPLLCGGLFGYVYMSYSGYTFDRFLQTALFSVGASIYSVAGVYLIKYDNQRGKSKRAKRIMQR